MSATLLRVPQVNVNDESVILVRWAVPPGTEVAEGELVGELETTKAVAEVLAPASGWLVPSAAAGDRIAVGAVIGAIASSVAEATAAVEASKVVSLAASGTLAATPKARALALKHGLSLDEVRQAGVTGSIKEADVQRFLATRPVALPTALTAYLDAGEAVSGFDQAVAANLRRSTERLILTSVDMDCPLSAAHRQIEEAKTSGRMVSLLHLLIASVAQALPEFPRLMSFADGGVLYRHQGVDVAFVARTSDGRLFTPVIRAADQAAVSDIAKAAQAATVRVLRGTAKQDELEGAAFTISQVPVAGTTRVVALPSFGQSAILGISAERMVPAVIGGAVVAAPIVTLTLNYDHAICDGVYAASFLARVTAAMQVPIR